MINKSELTKELYTPKEVARYLGITPRTLINWGNKDLIAYIEIKNEGVVSRRLYERNALINKLDEMGTLYDDTQAQRQDVIYARVSTHKQKARGDLDRQEETLKLYAVNQNPVNLISITDVASGLNDSRKGLTRLIDLIQNDKVNRVFVTYKDRLTRFGFNYLKAIADYHHTEIVIVSSETQDKSLEVELAEDIISIIHSFSGKLYGLRRQVKHGVDEALSEVQDD
jgi:Predicted site-specific integrase-resolvase